MNYIPNTDADRAAMLKEIGVASIDDLLQDIPASVRYPELNIPPSLTELEAVRVLRGLAEQNADLDHYACFLGAGAYRHFIPSVVPAITARSEFATAYTPYQPEISQGTLQAIYEYQSMVCELTGMDVSNASMYDGATAMAEAALMAMNVTGRTRFVVLPTVHPQYRQVLRTYVQGIAETEVIDTEGVYSTGAVDIATLESSGVLEGAACLIVQHPNFFGCLEDVRALSALARKHGALLVSVFEPISLGLLISPGEYGADIAVGEGQPLGIPVSFGGPYLGLFVCRERYVRQMPGRIVGATTDTEGRRGFVLTLQTREQHIRREKATSNICTNEALCALAATVYMSALGPQGLRKMAELSLSKAHYLADQLATLPGYSLPFKTTFFNEFVLRLPDSLTPAELNKRLLEQKIIGPLDLGNSLSGTRQPDYPELANCVLICTTEMNTKEDIDRFVATLRG